MRRCISLVVLVILALGLFGCDFEVGISDREKSNVNNINKSIEINEVKKIKISFDIGKLKVEKYDGDKLQIKANLKKKCKKYTVEDKDGVIDINIKSSGNIFKYTSNKDPELTVLVPKKYSDDLYINTGLGATEIKGVTGKNVEVKAGAGDLLIDNISFKNLKFYAGAGESNINLGKDTGNIDIKGGVGEVNVNLEEVNGDLSCACGMGEVNIQIPKNAPVIFNEKSGLGDCKITATTSGEDLFEYNLKVGIGEIEVHN